VGDLAGGFNIDGHGSLDLFVDKKLWQMAAVTLSSAMAICNLSDLPSLLTPGQCLLGLDYGRVVIGVAIANPDSTVASPLMGLMRRKFTQDREILSQIISERNVGGLILGLPKNMDGTEGPMVQAVRTFASNLLRRSALPIPNIPIVFWDERFSTAAIERAMIADDRSRKQRDETVDKAAAAYILQGALDALQRIKESKP
jgi:putative Holliday junction resolvase